MIGLDTRIAMNDDALPEVKKEKPSCCGRVITDLKKKVKEIKKDLVALSYAYRDPQCPTIAKVVLVATIGYAISPIDLIPDFIPVLGYLDDIIIVPAGIALAIKLIPKEVMDRAREQVKRDEKLPKSWVSGACVIGIQIASVAFGAYKLYNYATGK